MRTRSLDLVFGKVGCRKHMVFTSSAGDILQLRVVNMTKEGEASGVSRVQTQTDNIQTASSSAPLSYSVNRVSKWTSWGELKPQLDNYLVTFRQHITLCNKATHF